MRAKAAGKIDGAPTVGQVALVEEPRAAQLLAQVGDERLRQRGSAVLVAFPRADDEFASGQIEVQHPEAQTLVEAQACTVEQ